MLRRSGPALAVILIVALTAIVGRSQIPVDNTPIQPTIPQADRQDLNRVFLENADLLTTSSDIDYQILVGNVHFRRGGMNMYCDSAHFYDKSGNFDAFGNVKMRQGDTLFIDGDVLEYNDSIQLAVLYGEFGRSVTLRNRDVTLRTAIFNYDLAAELGYYDVGGELTDLKNNLRSVEGEYSPATKEATFRERVVLQSRSDKDTLNITTDNLYYNTQTHVAELTTYSVIQNGDGIIYTTNGIYNTETTQADLFENSLVTANNGNTLQGDTIYYNRELGFGEVFGNMCLTDTTNKVLMTGNYGFYNELTDSVFVTGRARAIDFSSADSLYIHADTIRAFRHIITRNVPRALPEATNDSLGTEPTDVVSLADTALDTDTTATPTPTSDIKSPEPAQLLPNTESTTEADSISTSHDSVMIYPVEEPEEESKIYGQAIMMYDAVTDTIRFVVAAPRVKFYRKDLQGLCDSLTGISSDTMIYMDRFPIVWSENRQITGTQIQIHTNDSTIQWAKVPQNGFMIEMIEPEYYNQLTGKEMFATFDGGVLSTLDVSGNVLAIFFPEENDSTINKMVNLESSFMAVKFRDNAIERMKLWDETNAVATPLYLAKKSMMYLPTFKWYGHLRPTSPDDIFNFPEELIEAFRTAPVYIPRTIPSRENTPQSGTPLPPPGSPETLLSAPEPDDSDAETPTNHFVHE